MNIKHVTSNKFLFERHTNVRFKSMSYLQTHNFYEFYYLAQGERQYFLNNTIYQLKQGDVLLIPPNVLHRSIGSETSYYSRVLMDIPKDVFETEFREKYETETTKHIYKIPKKRRAFFESLIEKLEYEYSNNDGYSDYLIRKYVNEILIFLMRMDKGYTFSYSSLTSNRVISSATLYMSEHYEKQLSLDDVAREVGMSKSHFCRLFKEKTGFNFSDYLTGVRINEATKLLLDTDLSITEIASRCGYNDSAYFAMIFKKVKGVTPLKYRKSPEL